MVFGQMRLLNTLSVEDDNNMDMDAGDDQDTNPDHHDDDFVVPLNFLITMTVVVAVFP